MYFLYLLVFRTKLCYEFPSLTLCMAIDLIAQVSAEFSYVAWAWMDLVAVIPSQVLMILEASYKSSEVLHMRTVYILKKTEPTYVLKLSLLFAVGVTTSTMLAYKSQFNLSILYSYRQGFYVAAATVAVSTAAYWVVRPTIVRPPGTSNLRITALWLMNYALLGMVNIKKGEDIKWLTVHLAFAIVRFSCLIAWVIVVLRTSKARQTQATS
jgi:hypothetical protein